MPNWTLEDNIDDFVKELFKKLGFKNGNGWDHFEPNYFNVKNKSSASLKNALNGSPKTGKKGKRSQIYMQNAMTFLYLLKIS